MSLFVTHGAGSATTTTGLICTIALLSGPLFATGCGTDDAGGDGSGISCGVGQLYDPATQKCVDNPNAADGTVSSSGGTSSGGTSSGGSSSGADAEGELPWALDDSGGLAKDSSAPFDPWWDCPPEKKNPTGKLHGEKCDKHEDCLYGRCFTGGPLAAYNDSVRFCTKNNGCGSGNLTSCTVDNGNGAIFYSVFEKSSSGGNNKRDPKKDVHKMCAFACKSDTDCAKRNPELPHCLKTSNSNKYVSFGTNAICGVDPDK